MLLFVADGILSLRAAVVEPDVCEAGLGQDAIGFFRFLVFQHIRDGFHEPFWVENHRASQMPVVSADPYLNDLLISYCEEALAHRKHRGSVRSRVENAIAPLLPHGKARIDEVARQLGLSQRTLARHLSREGVTFSQLLEKLRFDLTNRHLADPDLSISQIAWMLGYSEVSTFSHAFKRRRGQTPREARSQIAG